MWAKVNGQSDMTEGRGNLRGFGKTASILLLGVLCGGMGFAQIDRTSITGTVLDPSGKVIPNSLVVATESNVGVESAGRVRMERAFSSFTICRSERGPRYFQRRGSSSAKYEDLKQTVGRDPHTEPGATCCFRGRTG